MANSMQFERLQDWLDWQQTLHPSEIELGLQRVQSVASQLQLEQVARQIVLVAGTNGKGSTVACLEALLLQHGVSVGAYTSPHLFAYNERICIQGQAVSDADLMQAFAAIDVARGDTQLTFFEFATLAAMYLFQKAELDVAILEVGLGGRLDAVNILDADVAVITSVGMDHMDWLGHDLEQIGHEKAGILRPASKAVLAAGLPASISLTAEKLACDIYYSGDHFGRGDEVNWFSPALNLKQTPWAVLPRESQALALMALQLLTTANAASCCKALMSVELPGRFQCLHDGDIEVVYDVAHNLPACEHLLENLKTLAPARRTLAVFTSMQDKDCEGIIRHCAKAFDAWFLIEYDDKLERARQARDIAALLAEQGMGMISVSDNPRQAYARAKSLAAEGDRIVVFGSFYLVAPLLEQALSKQKKAEQE